MSTPAPTQKTRQSACSARRAKHASTDRGFCLTHRDVSTLVTAYRTGDRSGGLVFLQSDPVPGGSANAYDYGLQDPINQNDLNGLCVAGVFGSHCHNAVARFIHRAARPLVQYLKFRWQHEVHAYIAQAGITKTGSCHLIRHSVATMMLEGGADIRHVAEMLGHALLETTQRYTRVSIEHLRRVHAHAHPGAGLNIAMAQEISQLLPQLTHPIQ